VRGDIIALLQSKSVEKQPAVKLEQVAFLHTLTHALMFESQTEDNDCVLVKKPAASLPQVALQSLLQLTGVFQALALSARETRALALESRLARSSSSVSAQTLCLS